jgi:thiosulfate/3-mercaptopyruvate sulfurtransferase
MAVMKLFGFALAGALVLTAAPALRQDMLVTTDWLAQHQNDAKLVILHVSANRTAYDAGHVPGARFLGLSEIAIAKDGVPNELAPVGDLQRIFEGLGVSDDSRVILYGDASVLPATRAYFTLDYLGHGNQAALLDGGLEKWRSENRTLSKDAPAVTAGHFTPKVNAGVAMQYDAVSALASNKAPAPGPALLDVRPASDFTGEKGSHIPGSLNLNWMDTQVSRDNQTLKDVSSLRMMYESLGLKGDRPVVTYCNSGMQASQSYFTLKYLGYDVKMYDGSMSEWKAKGGATEK